MFLIPADTKFSEATATDGRKSPLNLMFDDWIAKIQSKF